MRVCITALILCFAASASAQVVPRNGLVVTASTTFAAGTYQLTEGITVAANNLVLDFTGVTLKGPGTTTSTTGLMLAGTSGVTVKGGVFTAFGVGLHLGKPGLGSASNAFSSAAFDGNGIGAQLEDWGTGGNAFTRCSFSSNAGRGLYDAAPPSTNAFTSCDFSHNGDDGLYLTYAAAQLDGCTVQDNAGNGIWFIGWYSVGANVKNSVISANKKSGGFQWSAPGVHWTNNTVERNKGNGFQLYGGAGGTTTDNGQFVGNFIGHNAGDGVGGFWYEADVLVQGNTIHDNGNNGVWTGDSFWTVKGNEIRSNKGAGVSVAADPTVTSNTIHENCGPGIAISADPDGLAMLSQNQVWLNGRCLGGDGVQLSAPAGFDAGKNGAGNYWGRATPALYPDWDTSGPNVTDSKAISGADWTVYGAVPADGMVVLRDTVFAPGTYALPHGIQIGCGNVRADFTGVTVKGSATGAGLSLGGVRRIAVKGGRFTGYDTGLSMQDTRLATLTGSSFDANARGARLGGWGFDQNSFTSCSFSSNTGVGLQDDAPPAGNLFTSCTFAHNGGNGATFSYAAATLDGVHAEWNGGDGIFFIGWYSVGAVVKNSVLSHNVQFGGHQWSAPGVRWDNDKVESNGAGGFLLYGGAGGSVTDNGQFWNNTIAGNGGPGIYGTWHEGDVLVAGNVIRDNAAEGVLSAADVEAWTVRDNDVHHNKGAGVSLGGGAELVLTNKIHANCGIGLVLGPDPTHKDLIDGNAIWGNGACGGGAGMQLWVSGPFDAAANGSHGNWWGRIGKPAIIPGVDTNSTAVTDSLASPVPPAWYDVTPPVTTATANGAAGLNGWYLGPVSVTLSATDDITGVASTSWQLDGAAASSYSGPIAVAGDGVHALRYWSIDVAGNVETKHVLSIAIDGTAPALAIAGGAVFCAGPGNPLPSCTAATSALVRVSATDATSGLASAAVTVDGAPAAPAFDSSGTAQVGIAGLGRHGIAIAASDRAGNTGALAADVLLRLALVRKPLSITRMIRFRPGRTLPVRVALHGGPGDPAVTRCGDEEETRLCGVSLYLYRQQIDCTTRAPVGPVVVASTGTSAGTDLFRVRDEEQVYRLSTKTFSAGACYDLLVYDGALPATAVVSIPVRAAIVRDEDDGDWGDRDEGR